ncbi:HTH_Tnp_Tc3_2 domain-containing protein [Trichonephila clavipes]|nr:HTH_Tnp_Tc3_2 domain-containing protein [Trichonephila clavipes]
MFNQFVIHESHFNVLTWSKAVMPLVRSRNTYQHVSDFDKGQIVTFRNCGLMYHSIAARVGRDPMTISIIWNRWFQDGYTECRAGSQQLPICSSQEDRHVTRMVSMNRAAASRALSKDLGSFGGKKCLHEQFDDVCYSMDSQHEDHGCGYP